MTDALARVRPGRSRWAAVCATAATYFYFLLFAEFSFLALAGGVATSASTLRLVMLGLGVGGISGAVAAAVFFRPETARAWLTWAFRACAVSAGFAMAAGNVAALVSAGVLCGLSLGALTVVLASTLRSAIGPERLGLCIGIGTGAAYAACNLPWVFHASPLRQTLLAAGIAAAASVLPRWMDMPTPGAGVPQSVPRGDALRWVVILLALVWLDSAAFYVVQHTPALRAATWNESVTLLINAAIHFGAACLAGAAVDGGHRRWVVGLAVTLLAVAILGLNGTLPAAMSANLLYTAGVSLYSVVLVEYPARSGRPGLAAVVFAVAGWAGSALGIGMAQHLATIPTGFVALALFTVAGALVWRTRAAAGVVVVCLALLGTVRASEAEVGREVYIAEGCIHCHSQYIRPRVAREVLNWGPATPLATALAANPPLLGTRRQGPDLSHVGNRRTEEWNRLHLITPQAISPGSKMPSYAYLFFPDAARGNALLTYLASLGGDTLPVRQESAAAWRPAPSASVSDGEMTRLFTQLCVQCHGATGRGDGVLAAQLSVRPPDWTRDAWRNLSSYADPETELALSRIIKFGLPGKPMAGHEYLSDAEIVGLARHVRKLHAASGSLRSASQP